MNLNFQKLNQSIIKCRKCPRLVKFRKKFLLKKENNTKMKLIGANQSLVLETQKGKFFLWD